jgi:hypothetical protein
MQYLGVVTKGLCSTSQLVSWLHCSKYIAAEQLAEDMGGTHRFDMEQQFAYIRSMQACYPADKHPNPGHSSNIVRKPEPKTALV